MNDLVEIRAIVRQEMVDRVIAALKKAGVPRLTVTRVHAIGAGVDPSTTKISWQEGSEYSDKVMVQLVCGLANCRDLGDVITAAARTGRRGDGIVAVYPVLDVKKIRTGTHGIGAVQ